MDPKYLFIEADSIDNFINILQKTDSELKDKNINCYIWVKSSKKKDLIDQVNKINDGSLFTLMQVQKSEILKQSRIIKLLLIAVIALTIQLCRSTLGV